MYPYIQSTSIVYPYIQSTSIVYLYIQSTSIVYPYIQSTSIVYLYIQSTSIVYLYIQSTSIVYLYRVPHFRGLVLLTCFPRCEFNKSVSDIVTITIDYAVSSDSGFYQVQTLLVGGGV